MHRLGHGYKITAPAKHRREDIDPERAASSDIWREWEKMQGRWRVESNTSTKCTRPTSKVRLPCRFQVQAFVKLQVLFQSPVQFQFRIHFKLPASRPGPDPVKGNPQIWAHTDAQRQSTTDTERLDRRYSGTSVLGNDIDTSTTNWYITAHKGN